MDAYIAGPSQGIVITMATCISGSHGADVASRRRRRGEEGWHHRDHMATTI